MMENIDCMACIANLAAGVPHNEATLRDGNGVTHGLRHDMPTGRWCCLCHIMWFEGFWIIKASSYDRGWRIE